MQNYNHYSDSEKAKLIHKYYIVENKSFQEIAKMYDTYPNRIRRDAKKLGIKSRSKSDAQKLALESGRIKHPTKDTKRSESVKDKIGNSVMKSWESLTDEEMQDRREKAKNNWDKLSDTEKQKLREEANVAIRTSSLEGSKLEKFLHKKLIENGYRVEAHKEHLLVATKLHIDLFLPEANIAIEVDGPSHFEPVWGDDRLSKTQEYDNKKTGILIGKKISLIRIKQTRDYSKSRAGLLLNKLLKAIDETIKNKTEYLEIGDE